MDQPVLYREPGASWWPVLWGPVFGLVGLGVEALTGAVFPLLWLLVAAGLSFAALVWVQGRRRLHGVLLTPAALHLGREEVRVRDIAEVSGVEPRAGARILGGGWTEPRGTGPVPVRLADGEVVLGWARDPEALRAALDGLLATRAPRRGEG
ncbi:hypothetical protein ABZ816_11860 [Actinosynnema sp. NPDC047251]|uniref:Putative membrane protein n=1 Tax=Saccharothrix espanaensis (strain ATCC 51144 / DSM 44229 / JCM 9112 / NBRC 15066 / NRRL 15764) TaxID=1179773 RepID=K0KCL9_SACES|nr:hypothetical protein [Saccharothrix espanaensis]CCH35292.1 putative membrane protein [Saccharothrix espanaensis DSM 44229]